MRFRIFVYDKDEYEVAENNVCVFVTHKETNMEYRHYGGKVVFSFGEDDDALFEYEMYSTSNVFLVICHS